MRHRHTLYFQQSQAVHSGRQLQHAPLPLVGHCRASGPQQHCFTEKKVWSPLLACWSCRTLPVKTLPSNARDKSRKQGQKQQLMVARPSEPPSCKAAPTRHSEGPYSQVTYLTCSRAAHHQRLLLATLVQSVPQGHSTHIQAAPAMACLATLCRSALLHRRAAA